MILNGGNSDNTTVVLLSNQACADAPFGEHPGKREWKAAVGDQGFVQTLYRNI